MSHDPVPPPHLLLSDWFASVKDIKQHYFWLDFKNLNENNRKNALSRLTFLTEKYGINPSDLIVESRRPDCLTSFTESGFRTSYYLPTVHPYKTPDDEIVEIARKINSSLLSGKVNYLSSNYISYWFIKFYFPQAHILLWTMTGNDNNRPVIKNVLDDPCVKVFLKEELMAGEE
ncbi:MAG: hypothetical protein FWF54_03930 [Candidatus Azobacteroides sp.]|nr:hypothetical protein [Candidatus Azobacteroides sp.]